jgi:hypothetical protein
MTIYYQGKLLCFYNEYINGSRRFVELKFESLDSLMALLLAPDTDEITRNYSKETIGSFKRKIESMSVVFYLNDNQNLDEGKQEEKVCLNLPAIGFVE